METTNESLGYTDQIIGPVLD
nr:RecName: Full=ATP synthase subunit beta, chloroplastic; AltName: Full=ATP synthase F1 subunit beta; AltName: Full=F-ATPase subunit beta [Chattonella marina var. antiqua]